MLQYTSGCSALKTQGKLHISLTEKHLLSVGSFTDTKMYVLWL